MTPDPRQLIGKAIEDPGSWESIDEHIQVREDALGAALDALDEARKERDERWAAQRKYQAIAEDAEAERDRLAEALREVEEGCRQRGMFGLANRIDTALSVSKSDNTPPNG